MRGVKVFTGRSHPALAEAICQRLGTSLSDCQLGHFANGETRVEIGTSIRNENVFIVQSGSSCTNDSVVELLIMIAACKTGSAKSITAVLPYFPYSRSSKKKTHRGSITAKMIANLMQVAGVSHIITVDLHASQMQGFFRTGVDNIHSEPLISRWIRGNVPGWQDAVVVSKNVGGSKRVTSLADALKLSFAIISTDKARAPQPQLNMSDSMVFFDAIEPQALRSQRGGAFLSRQNYSTRSKSEARRSQGSSSDDDDDDDADNDSSTDSSPKSHPLSPSSPSSPAPSPSPHVKPGPGSGLHRLGRSRNVKIASSPLIRTINAASRSPPESANGHERNESTPSARRPSEYEAAAGFHDEKAREVITGRLIHGHIVDDDHPSPALSGISLGHSAMNDLDNQIDPMTSSMISNASSFLHPNDALGGSVDAAVSSDDDEERVKNAEVERTVTLVGNVKDKTVLLMDDLMDKSGSWIAAAETCVKRGGARRVYCIGIHGLFGADSLEEMEACECIDYIVVTNTFPIAASRVRKSKKLVIIDLSNLLSEAIRRNHHGESMSKLFMHD